MAKEVNMKQQPFYIGQKVVALKTISTTGLIKDKVYVVTGIKACVRCGVYSINVGIKIPGNSTCACDNETVLSNTGIWWADVELFAPLHEGFQSITFEKILETELTSAN